jgi:hypothetical protein
MTPDESGGSRSETVDTELMNNIASDALGLLRVNLLVLTIFISAIALIIRETDMGYIARFGSSIYTVTAILLWFGSILGAVFAYRSARRTSLRDEYPNRGLVDDEMNHVNEVSAISVSSVGAVVCLIFGALDGLNTGGIPVTGPVVLAVVAIAFVSVSFNFFSGMELFRDKAPGWFWDFFFGRW